MSDEGLLTLHSGRVRPIVRGSWDTPQSAPPLWAGGALREAWIYGPAGVDRTSSGQLLLSGYHGVMLRTSSARGARLEAAINTATQRTVWQRKVTVTLTRPARVRVRARRGKRTLVSASADLPAGRSQLALPRRLPGGVHELQLRAVAANGAIATHRIKVLGRPRLPLAAARRTLMSTYGGIRRRGLRADPTHHHPCRRRLDHRARGRSTVSP